jgi:hypothetical protein
VRSCCRIADGKMPAAEDRGKRPKSGAVARLDWDSEVASFESRQYDGQYLCTDSAIFNIKITTTPVGAYG